MTDSTAAPPTSELAAFVTRMLDADEAAARAATPGPWSWWNLEGADQGWSGQGPDLQHVTDEWRECPYFCRWTDADSNHRGEQGKPGHEHRVTETVIGSWGHDAWGLSIEPPDAAHIAHHDPARVLAQVAALRAVVALAEEAHEAAISIRGIDWSVPLEDRGAVESASYGAAERAYEEVLRHLAAIWASDPAFDPAWSA